MRASPREDWVRAACAGVFLPMIVNLLVLASYYFR
jgi:hypothetical protein